MSVKDAVIGTAVEVFFAAIALGILYRVWGFFFTLPKRQVVLVYQKGVRLKKCGGAEVLEPGVYWARPQNPIVLCDMRATPFQFANVGTHTADGEPVALDVSGEFRTVDPAAFVVASTHQLTSVYNATRTALDTAMGEFPAETDPDGMTAITMRMKELLLPQMAVLGVELEQLTVRGLRVVARAED